MLALIVVVYSAVIVVWAGIDGLRRHRKRHAIKAEVDQVIAAFRALPPDEQRRLIHPGSPQKPPDWTADEYLGNDRE